MPRQVPHLHTMRCAPFQIPDQRLHHRSPGQRSRRVCHRRFCRMPGQPVIHPGQQPGVMIGTTAIHRALQPHGGPAGLGPHRTHRRQPVRQVLQPPVQLEGAMRKILGQPMHHLIAQWRNLAVLLRVQPVQPGIARVHHKAPAAGRSHHAHEVMHELVVLTPIDADAMLDRHRHLHHRLHRCHTIGHPLGLGHQAGAKGPLAHPVTGAAAVQVDLVVAIGLPLTRGPRQQLRIIAAQLQHHALALLAPPQQMVQIAMRNGLRRHHLGIQPGPPRQQPVKAAAMAVGPVHHRRHRDAKTGRQDKGGGSNGHRTGTRQGGKRILE